MAGLHENFERDEENLGSTDRGFGQVFAGVFALVAAFKWWFDNSLWPWWLTGATVFLVLAYAAPKTLAPLNRLWMKFGLLLYRIVNPLTMGFLFFLVMTPMGVVMRVFGKDFLRRRRDPAAPSYWILREPPGPAPDSMKNQF
jgi:predicted membrane metal-binding protein